MAKILFVKPKNTSKFSSEQPPLELLSVAGYLKKNGHEVEVIDAAIGMEISIESLEKVDYVFIGMYVLNRRSSIELIKLIKKLKPSVKIVIGTIFCEDSFATTLWELALNNFKEIDICILGEAEETMLRIVNGVALAEILGIAYRSGNEIKKNEDFLGLDNLDNYGFPAWELIDFSRYKPTNSGVFNGIDLCKEITVPLRFSRGCIGSCKYCALWWMWKKWRTRSGEHMAQEIIDLNSKYGIKSFEFRDDCFGVNKEEVANFCEAILCSGIKVAFSVSSRVDVLDSEDDLLRLKKAGCYKILYGIETGSQRILDEFKKGVDVKKMKDTILLAKKIGFAIHALMIVGSSAENETTINETIDFLNEVKPETVSAAGGVMLMPGTAYYGLAKKSGQISDEFWLGEREYITDPSVSKFKIFIFSKAIRNRKKIKNISDEYNIINILQYLGSRILRFFGLGKLSEMIALALIKKNVQSE